MRELMIETNPDAIAYGLDVMQDLARVRAGSKPLVIASAGKCKTATLVAYDIAKADPTLHVQIAELVCEDGEIHWHVFVCKAGAPYANDAIELIMDTVSEAAHAESPHAASVLRERLQLRLGLLLGHSAAECVEFSASEIGRTCPCDCCGSQFTAEEVESREDREARIRRTMYHA